MADDLSNDEFSIPTPAELQTQREEALGQLGSHIVPIQKAIVQYMQTKTSGPYAFRTVVSATSVTLYKKGSGTTKVYYAKFDEMMFADDAAPLLVERVLDGFRQQHWEAETTDKRGTSFSILEPS